LVEPRIGAEHSLAANQSRIEIEDHELHFAEKLEDLVVMTNDRRFGRGAERPQKDERREKRVERGALEGHRHLLGQEAAKGPTASHQARENPPKPPFRS
jgi:hypothetical protein